MHKIKRFSRRKTSSSSFLYGVGRYAPRLSCQLFWRVISQVTFCYNWSNKLKPLNISQNSPSLLEAFHQVASDWSVTKTWYNPCNNMDWNINFIKVIYTNSFSRKGRSPSAKLRTCECIKKQRNILTKYLGNRTITFRKYINYNNADRYICENRISNRKWNA